MDVMGYMRIITDLPCLHTFHQEFVSGWLAQVRNMILVCSCFYREMLEIIILIITIVHAHWLQSTAHVVSAATAALERKSVKYSSLLSNHIFCLVAIETLGLWQEVAFLYQRISNRKITINQRLVDGGYTSIEQPGIEQQEDCESTTKPAVPELTYD